ncbi:DinB family protein [Micromonospora orduensis]|uniref:DinB family protein n=1 Tax=Micromonospora orduensis TaxID=1420891 RepID=UPI00380D3DF4
MFDSSDSGPRNAPEPTPRESRNWSIVITSGCRECGFEAGSIAPDEAARRLRTAMLGWETVLAGPTARQRPAPQTWSPTEYACHVRDLCRLLPARLAVMVSFEDPQFENWDQDEAVVRHAYWAVRAAEAAADLRRWAAAAASTLEAVIADQMPRTGRRSDGTRMTIGELCATFVHEVEHHLQDAGGPRPGHSHIA